MVTVQDMTPLEELERQRAQFLGMISHELRGPLTSIKGSAAILLESPSSLEPAETVQLARIIDSQANRMRDLISDLLVMARIEAGTLSVAPEPADVARLVDEARNNFLSGGGRENIVIDLDSGLPWVQVDRRGIVQVLDNLLTNAAKYSDDSSPIRLGAILDDLHVELSVADQGRGVPPERLAQLFSKFSRIEGDEGARVPLGVGLGLAICKGIVEAHGGRIWAESDGPGLGARFAFTLPILDRTPADSPVEVPARSRRSQGGDAERTRIVVVDDDAQTLRYVRDTLTKAGYAAIVTANPDETPSLIKENRPALVLLDLVLPGTDGIELMKSLRAVTDVPVIFLSGYGSDDIVSRALEAGATDYVVKPFSPTELVARIRAALRRQAATSQGGARLTTQRTQWCATSQIRLLQTTVGSHPTAAGGRISRGKPGNSRLSEGSRRASAARALSTSGPPATAGHTTRRT